AISRSIAGVRVARGKASVARRREPRPGRRRAAPAGASTPPADSLPTPVRDRPPAARAHAGGRGCAGGWARRAPRTPELGVGRRRLRSPVYIAIWLYSLSSMNLTGRGLL